MEAQDRFVPALPQKVERVLEQLKSLLTERLGGRFTELRLFGSYARGEQHDESDIDVLVLFDGEGWDDDTLFRAVAEVDVTHGVCISPLRLSRRQYAEMVESELGIALDIEREGMKV